MTFAHRVRAVTARRAGAATTLTGIATMTLGLLLLPSGPGSLAAVIGARGYGQAASTATPTPSPTLTPTPTPSPSRTHSPKPKPKRHRPHGTTVTGPRMFNPKTFRRFARPSTVTVSQTGSLVNQMVQVSWTNFTPSSEQTYDPAVTDYPVMVAECNTPRPAHWNQCYGANNGGVQGSFGAFGPMNTAYATTASNGTGQLDIQILTLAANANQFLGCAVDHACSLVIVPSQGGDSLSARINCDDHSMDAGELDEGQFAFSNQTGQCSWRDRIVVPLTFSPQAANCSIKKASFTVLGSPMLARAMDQWRAGLCQGSSPLAVTYQPSITEPEGIADLPSGLGDVALTTRPAASTKIGGKTYAYAPVAISAVAIAYWIDSPKTGHPDGGLKLNQRLLAKLLTQSYNFDQDGCAGGSRHPKSIGCDSAVDGNPLTLFADPEFRRLDPTIKSPTGFGAAFQVPTVESGHSDMTWEVTRWIGHNEAAAGFVAGQFDQWGTHVNTDFLGLKYPLDSFTSQDSYPIIAHKYNPVFPLASVANYQVENWDPGTSYLKDQFGNFPVDPIQVPGERALFAILDEADAAAYLFPTAAIRNSKGDYVAPSAASMEAALPSMITGTSNKITQRVDYNKQGARAYPLTMVIYALVPTSGISRKKATAIARFLAFVAGPGQARGLHPGQLPPGYLPLTARMRAQTLAAAALVLKQKGNHPAASPTPVASSPATPTATPTPTLGQGVVTVALKSGQTAGPAGYALPVLLIVGGVATFGGIASLIAGAGGAAIAARMRRIRRVRLVWRWKQ